VARARAPSKLGATAARGRGRGRVERTATVREVSLRGQALAAAGGRADDDRRGGEMDARGDWGGGGG
jgi:hypothetical protein